MPVEVGDYNDNYIQILSGAEQDQEVFLRYQNSAPSGGDSTSAVDDGEGGGHMPDFGGGNMPDFGGGGNFNMPGFGGGMLQHAGRAELRNGHAADRN